MKITSVKVRKLRYSAPILNAVIANPLDAHERFSEQRARMYEEARNKRVWKGPDIPRRMAVGTLDLVEVNTNEGLSGRYYVGGPLESYIIEHHLSRILVGEDPFDIELLWDQMYRASLPYGRKGAAIMAIGAVDVALWDLIGKAKSEPLYRLLGGRSRNRIKAYASHLHPCALDELAKEATDYVEQGFTAMKQRMIAGPADGLRGMRMNLELVKTVREAIGSEIELMVDAFMSWSVNYAIRMIKMLEKFELTWVEEPLIPDDADGYSKVRASVDTPISGGEHEYTMYGFKDLIDRKAVDILQPDVVWSGGITCARKICALAEVNGLPVIPHYSRFPTLHLIMSKPIYVCPMAEYMTKYNIYEFVENPIMVKNGYVDVPENHGLGIVWNEKAILENTISGEKTPKGTEKNG